MRANALNLQPGVFCPKTAFLRVNVPIYAVNSKFFITVKFANFVVEVIIIILLMS